MNVNIDFIAARGLRSGTWFDKSDPYVVLKVGEEEHMTPSIANTEDPEWEESFTFTDVKMGDVLFVTVMDHDITPDQCLGTVQIPVSLIPLYHSTRASFSLGTQDGQYCGALTLGYWITPHEGMLKDPEG